MEDKVKNFEEYLNLNLSEGLFSHADWVDMDLLQGTIERMRSDEYKDALAALNSNFPIDKGIKYGLDVDAS